MRIRYTSRFETDNEKWRRGPPSPPTNHAEKLSFGADSVLASLDQAEFAAGLEAIRSKHAAKEIHGPVVEPIDFFVFAKGPASDREP